MYSPRNILSKYMVSGFVALLMWLAVETLLTKTEGAGSVLQLGLLWLDAHKPAVIVCWSKAHQFLRRGLRYEC
jgi:hypothetical protein